MKAWRCSVCGYIHRGEELIDVCPNCNATSDKFVEYIEKESTTTDIHLHYGQLLSYGKEVVVNPFFGDYNSLAGFIYNLPIGQETPLHKHPSTDELFYIIKGKLKFRVGDKELVACAGDLIQGKMDVPHTFKNIGDEPAAFLSIKGPKPVDIQMIGGDN